MNKRKKQKTIHQSKSERKITLEDWLLASLVVGVFFMIVVLVWHNLAHG